MRAITILPGVANSARLEDVPEPPKDDGAILVDTIALGVCGTDHEIVAGHYGEAPDGQKRLILGHESLGRVREAPSRCGFAVGEHIVGIVRQPDPVPCPACATGEWDMCRNGLYTEHGIKGRNGFGAERFRIAPDFAVKVDPALGILGVLLEPTSVVAKAWDHCDRVWRLKSAPARTLLVTGAGPIGLLGALLGAQRGYEVHVYDHNASGPKPALVRDLGGIYHSGELDELAALAPDLVMECTGVPQVIAALLSHVAADSVICLAGVGAPAKREFDIGAFNRMMVLNNGTVFGTVNANRRHYAAAADALARADRDWLARLITRRVPLDNFTDALTKQKGDIKVVIDFAQA
ncbi:MAG: theronine dehydrogenase [Alphaproteobacteria bacterium]|nr:MAG: theronine dehydrogenase [Alphaproteobacteria bacterium]